MLFGHALFKFIQNLLRCFDDAAKIFIGPENTEITPVSNIYRVQRSKWVREIAHQSIVINFEKKF